MACDTTTLVNGLVSAGDLGLDDHNSLLALAGALSQSTGGTSANTAMAGAAANGYYALSQRAIDEAILARLCTTLGG